LTKRKRYEIIIYIIIEMSCSLVCVNYICLQDFAAGMTWNAFVEWNYTVYDVYGKGLYLYLYNKNGRSFFL